MRAGQLRSVLRLPSRKLGPCVLWPPKRIGTPCGHREVSSGRGDALLCTWTSPQRSLYTPLHVHTYTNTQIGA